MKLLITDRCRSHASVADKNIEHILVSNINKHLALDSILADCQHGFRSQRFCETKSFRFELDIISNLDGAINRGLIVMDIISNLDGAINPGLIIMDFAKAID